MAHQNALAGQGSVGRYR